MSKQMTEADHQKARDPGLVEVPKHFMTKIKACKTAPGRKAVLEEIKNDYRATVCAAKAFVEKMTGRVFPEQGEDHTVITKKFYRLKARYRQGQR
jgi:hypothetical protein